jgi:hypothetical protein
MPGRSSVVIHNSFSRRARLAATGSAVALLATGGAAAAALSGSRGPVAARPLVPSVAVTTKAPTTTAALSTTTSAPPPNPAVAPVRLVSYGGCTQFLAAVKAEAMKEVGPYGLRGLVFGGRGPVTYNGTATVGAVPAASVGPAGTGSSPGAGSVTSSPASASAAQTAPQSTPSYSGTNNQENGVDEPDLTKTDGDLLLILRHSPVGLQVAEVSSSPPHLDGFVALPQVGPTAQLFLTGSYAVVIGATQWQPSMSAPAAEAPGTDVVIISLKDPAHPTVARSFNLQGIAVGARLVAGRIVVVLQGQPNLSFVTPTDRSASAQAAATRQNQAIVASSTASDWLPSVTESPSRIIRTAGCATALHPTVASGLGTVSVVSLDPRSDQPGSEVTVVGSASTVYASTSSLFVATTTWAQQMGAGSVNEANVSPPENLTTDIHGFDVSNPAAPRYIGSGVVPGTLIGQYALSEYDGYLRVATTVGQATPPPNEGSTPEQLSDNRVTVLAPVGQALVAVGSVSGLGQGEKSTGSASSGRSVTWSPSARPTLCMSSTCPTRPARL